MSIFNEDYVNSQRVRMNEYGQRYVMDMDKIRGHIMVAQGEPMVFQHEDHIADKLVYEYKQRMGVQVDECVADEIFRMMKDRLAAFTPMVNHTCHNCGGHIELDEEKHIFHCPYCDTVYAVGINHLYSR